ncbi:MAG: preprotein translocase subunit SecY [Bacilli bacterium]|nr:preprotein translocase subunit SecY [Bacilli bacterium]
MFRTIRNIWTVGDIRSRILFTLLMLVVFRLGSFIPVPNIDASQMSQLGATNQIFNLLNTFSGGALQNFSLFAMSITPYITASIIVQLLQMGVIPRFEEWAKEGEHGRRKLTQITRYGTVILGLVQAVAFTYYFNRNYGVVVDTSWKSFLLIVLSLTAGTTFLMWLGEQITEKGIGNGISILIFTGIIARTGTGIQQLYVSWFYNKPGQLTMSLLYVLLLLIASVLIIAGVIYVQQGVRRIPIQYAQRVVGRKVYGGQSTHLPLKVNAAGVIPVIFASSLLIFPSVVAGWMHPNRATLWIQSHLAPGGWLYIILEVIFTIAFTYFYTYIQLNPEQLVDNMRKNQSYIPGIRPGQPTLDFITRVINRITVVGALFLAAVTALPFAVSGALQVNLYFGGTSLLIITGVALETMKQVESQLIQRHYRGFIR